MSKLRHAPTVAVVCGELSALTLLAPMEWQTASYIGVPSWAAWTVTGVVYSVAILSILTGKLVWAALGLVWVSGIVGAVHAAGEKAATEGATLDRMRTGTSVAVVTIVVLAMAAVWHLGQVAHASIRAAEEAELARRDAADADRRASQERATQARRDHEIAVMRERQDAAERASRLAAEAEASRAQREADERAAEHARAIDLLRAQSVAQREPHPERKAAPKATRRDPRRRPAEPPQTDSDLQRRAKAKADAMDLLRDGNDVDAREFAMAYYGTTDPTEKDMNAARANLSTWRRAVAAERADPPQAEAGR